MKVFLGRASAQGRATVVDGRMREVVEQDAKGNELRGLEVECLGRHRMLAQLLQHVGEFRIDAMATLDAILHATGHVADQFHVDGFDISE